MAMPIRNNLDLSLPIAGVCIHMIAFQSLQNALIKEPVRVLRVACCLFSVDSDVERASGRVSGRIGFWSAKKYT